MAIVGGSRVALSKGSSASGPRFKLKTVQQAGKKRLSSPPVGSRAAQATAVKRAQPLELLETFLKSRPRRSGGTLLDWLGKPEQVRDDYSARGHLTLQYFTGYPESLKEWKTKCGVHGTRVSNVWSILSDNNVEHSREKVVMWRDEPLEGVYAFTSGTSERCSYYSPWQSPWAGESDVFARVFVWLQADTNGVVALKGTDWLVFCNPWITHVVFQFAAVEDFGEFGAFDQVQEWDIRLERIPKGLKGLCDRLPDDTDVAATAAPGSPASGPRGKCQLSPPALSRPSSMGPGLPLVAPGSSASGPRAERQLPQRPESDTDFSVTDVSDAQCLEIHPQWGVLHRFRVVLCGAGVSCITLRCHMDMESESDRTLYCGEQFAGYFIPAEPWIRMGNCGFAPST